MPNLFDPITLRGLTIKNRVWVSPMCQYSAVDGVVGDWHMAHLGAFATGEAGLVMAEASGVVPEG
jgi:2,4-dienoyl-CoA reductase-like NADH-dependent reductase (Old Yellow Enzyme family)